MNPFREVLALWREENQVQAKMHQLLTFFLLFMEKSWFCSENQSLSSLYPQYTQEPFLVQSWEETIHKLPLTVLGAVYKSISWFPRENYLQQVAS